MPHNSSQWINHQFTGGWATDFGKTFYGNPEGGTLALPWLNQAENIQYTLDGKIQKAPGSRSFLFASPPLRDLAGDTNIRGLYDYTRVGTSAGSSSTQLIVACGSDFFKWAVGDSRFVRIGSSTGFSLTSEIPHFSTFNDLLIIANSSLGNTFAPYSWDQTTFQNLAGSPPSFSIATHHRGRHWAAGVVANPSRLYYSAAGNPEDWVGSGSGSIDIDPGDGDSIVGLWSWKNELWVFKGNKKLSIHRISGSSPSDFVRSNFIVGISAAGQHSIFSYGDDIYFWNPYGSLHSLKATDTYGDYAQAYLNYPMLSWCRKEIGRGGMDRSQTAVFPNAGYGITTCSAQSSPRPPLYPAQTNDTALLIDFRFIQHEHYPRFAFWPYLKMHAVTFGKNITLDPALIVGDEQGNVLELGQAGLGGEGIPTSHTHLGSDIKGTIQTPFLTYGNPIETKTLVHVGINLAPDEHHTSTITVAWNDETGFAQSTSVTHTFGVPLGTFVLGTDSLGTNGSRIASIEPMYGDFRSMQYTLSETSDKKITIQSFSSLITPSGESLEA